MTISDTKFDLAMMASADLISCLKESGSSPVLSIFSDLWAERHNVPIITTMYEAAQEMLSPIRQSINGKLKH